MHHDRPSGPFSRLFADYQAGSISRRGFIGAATALGMSVGVARFCADASAQNATPGASPAAAGATYDRPTAGTDGQTRGEGGDLRILQWQAPSGLNPQTATGDKDGLASMLVVEPLMFSGKDGVLVPNLITEVPTVENGMLADDLTWVKYTLLEGVTWSDGTPFTAADVVFTWQWVTDRANAAVYYDVFTRITNIEATDDLNLTVTFDSPNPTWYDTHAGGGGSGSILPKHILEAGADAATAYLSNPIGTGPYKVESFEVNNQVVYVANDTYREPNKPFFAKVILTGGGDAGTAARAAIQTGETDYAWNLALEPEVLRSMESDSNPGQLVVVPGTGIERINLNFSDPDTEVDGQKSEMNTPHPILSDIAVRQAMVVGIDRQKIADALFFSQEGEPAIANILSGISTMESPNTVLEFNADKARQILDDAGWTQDGDVRKKDDKELKLRYATTVSQLRQKIQQIVKANLEDIGFKIELEQVDGGVFFDSAVGNDQSNTHFYTDTNMFTSTVTAPPPVSYMIRWYAGADRANIAQKSNGWAGRNIQRYANADYDALYEQAQTEANPEASAQLFIQMNDILYNDAAVIPLVRAGSKVGVSRRLDVGNIGLEAFEFDYWNIANWRTV